MIGILLGLIFSFIGIVVTRRATNPPAANIGLTLVTIGLITVIISIVVQIATTGNL